MTQSSARILVVDDEPNLLEALIECVERAGHKALAAATGAEALSLLVAQDADAALIDINLPDFSGPELLRRLANLGKAMPARFMTADANEAERSEAQDLSGAAAIQKPISPRVLAKVFEALLGPRDAH